MRAFTLAFAAFLLSSCTLIGYSNAPQPPDDNASIVRYVLKRGLAGDEDTINGFVAENYKQHNPLAEDGRAGLLAFVRSMKPGSISVKPLRMLSDGDFVAVHSDVTIGDERFAVFDLFIVRDRQLIEHWDCIQTAKGDIAIEGSTEIADLNETENNRKLVADFFDRKLLKGDLAGLGDFLSESPLYHNGGCVRGPDAWDGEKYGLGYEYKKVHRVIAEGNFVLAQCECQKDGKQFAVYELFRIAKHKIVEHWYTIQEVPATSKNKNGMF